MAVVAKCFWCGVPHLAENPLSVCPTCLGVYRARRFPLGPLEMSGSFPLEDAMIDEMVRRTSPGNFALGYLDEGTFQVFYVGRSDTDVRRRLHEWVGAPAHYRKFAPSSQAAWGQHRREGQPLAAPALDHVGVDDSGYTRFAFSYAPSAAAAFEKQCRNYDDFGGSGGLDNAARPVSAA